MTLISLLGWDMLLLVSIEDSGQPWFMQTKLERPDVAKYPPYPMEKLLHDWMPEAKHMQ